MEFGKRLQAEKDRPLRVKQVACARCHGTGRTRERGHPIACKTCAGSGRVTVKFRHD